MKEIVHPLLETTRPPLYTAMKYWGKKPHNIWREYIAAYTPADGLVFDPFCGSAVSAFEAAAIGRRAVAFDINPLCKFAIEAIAAPFHEDAYRGAVRNIVAKISRDAVYRRFFTSQSRRSNERAEVRCFKWDSGEIYEIGIEETAKEAGKRRPQKYLAPPSKEDLRIATEMESIAVADWHPAGRFHSSPSFSPSFLRGIGGDDFSNLWTRRNLYVLAKIFAEILKYPAGGKDNLRLHLLFGFIQGIHLCCKMCVPRRGAANRPFSTSWGRSAYICSSRQMEMNALRTFAAGCLGKQSAESCLRAAAAYFGGRLPRAVAVGPSAKRKNDGGRGFDIKYGVVDANGIGDYLPDESVDFVITDPPYGGLVQYLDLSCLWLRWLEKHDPTLSPTPLFAAEITEKKGAISYERYERGFLGALQQIHRVLKNDGRMVITFHNKDIRVWNTFLKSLSLAGFGVVRVLHQYNRRSGEAAVSNPYGTAATDFYIQCKKSPSAASGRHRNFADFVLKAAIQIIAARGEPTPYQVLEDSLIAAISKHGHTLDNFNQKIADILGAHTNDLFRVEKRGGHAGDMWWFKRPDDHIQYRLLPLHLRVEQTVVNLLRRKTSVDFDDAIGEIFVHFFNGLTPDMASIEGMLQKHASPVGGRWVCKDELREADGTAHTQMLKTLAAVGVAASFRVHIGLRERAEKIGGGKLGDCADAYNLADFLGQSYKDSDLKTLSQTDMLWLRQEGGEWKIAALIEVENTTGFVAALHRASCAGAEVAKFMIIPDKRQPELDRRRAEDLFGRVFSEHNWKTRTYSEIKTLSTRRGGGAIFLADA
jgi:SAM-dependent methyltransferase